MAHPIITENPELAVSIDILDRWIALTAHKKHLPGLAAGVVYDGQLIWGKGYGFADLAKKEPVTLDTRFRIASISKTFTATAILQLRDAGRLRLDDPVSAHIHWFNLRYEGAPEITIRNLLTHSSGLPRDSVGPMWTDLVGPTPEDFVAETQKRLPTQPPNNQFAYSNLGYSLLGLIIESISGDAWATYIQKNILDPLGMVNTHPVPAGDDPALASGYTRTADDYSRSAIPFFLLNAFAPSAEIASSLNDLAKYATFHLGKEGSGILSEHTLRDMHRVHWLSEGWDEGYGLGIAVSRINDWQITGHGGAYPGHSTGFSLSRGHNMGVIVLTNAINNHPSDFIERTFKLLLPEIIEATKATKPQADPAWEVYVGDYESDWGVESVIVRKGELQIISLESIDLPPVILKPTDVPHVFTITEPNQSNETARFELDADGRAVRLWVRNEYGIRK